MNMDQAEKHELIIEVMAEKIARLQRELEDMARSRSLWMSLHDDLQDELNKRREKTRSLIASIKPKKRGPGRPKKVKK